MTLHLLDLYPYIYLTNHALASCKAKAPKNN